MNVADYPVTLVYGAYGIAGYTKEHPHRGRDYGCPIGTPLVVGGQQIGLSGATGKVTGPHCHVQEWKDNYANTREPNNAFQPGTVVNTDPYGTQGDGTFGKFITVQNSDGWNDSYCHLSSINVKVGDIVGGSMDIFNDGDRTTWLREASVIDVGQYSELVGKVSFKVAVEKMRNEGLFRPNPGDVINAFNIYHAKPSDADTAVWIQQSMKKLLFEKVAEGVAKMPPPGIKPYDGPPIFIEDK